MAFGNGPRLVTTGLDLLVDAADRQSYPGSGTSWRDLKSTITGSLTGSISYTTEFYGGLTFTDSSSAVIFPSTVASYGTGSFTIEMAFKPTFINGRHYLMSKNSGSFPNWAIYLSGSAGAGKLWSEFRISSTVSCSVSSSTTFVTGSVYQVDVVLAPGSSGSGITVNGIPQGGVLGNGGGTLTNTSSLFIGNFSQNNTQNFSGSIYTTKVYGTTGFILPVVNYNAISTRFSQLPVSDTVKKVFELLVVAGGGGGGQGIGGGGGAGGLQYFSNYNIPIGTSTVIVGDGGNNNFRGSNSSFSTFISIGGGDGGSSDGTGASTAGDGGSGGGGGYLQNQSGSGTLGQGNSGGVSTGFSAAGGGGAGSVGINGVDGGQGGSGSFIASFAAVGGSPSGWFAGGGGKYASPGGIGGTNVSFTGSSNTGAGGSGGASGGGVGYKGGSGIVAIRYNGAPIALGGEITQSGGFTYHVYRTVGTSSFTIF